MTTIKDLIVAFPNKEWDWKALTISKFIPVEFLIDNYTLPWDWYEATSFLPFSFIQDHPDFAWNWNYLSSYVCIDQIIENPHLKWDWKEVSMHPDLTPEIIFKFPDFNWHWNLFCIDDHCIGQKKEEEYSNDDEYIDSP